MTETNEQQRVRPRFLIFLCILTFSSATSGLWSRSEQLWNPGQAMEMYYKAYDAAQELIERNYPEREADSLNSFVETIKKAITPESVRNSSVVFIVYESMTLFGAFFMWSLRRKGFYIYLGGIAAVFLGHLALVGGLLGLVLCLGSVVSSGFFSILYYLNLKYMD